MHPICSKAEVDELISHMNSEGLIWIDNDIKRITIRKEASSREGAVVLKENKIHIFNIPSS